VNVLEMNDNDISYIGIGSVSLYVNRDANIWSGIISYLSRTARALKDNYSDAVPVQIIVVFIIPGFRNPVAFSGTRITIKSRKGPKRVQVEAAMPDIPFPESDPEKAKRIVLDLMLDAVKEVEAYANKNKIIQGDLSGARAAIRELWKEWDVSGYHYSIPDNLPYYDLPKVNEFTTRRFIEKLPDGGEKHYNIVLDADGNEVL
jgi:hypothetical protein